MIMRATRSWFSDWIALIWEELISPGRASDTMAFADLLMTCSLSTANRLTAASTRHRIPEFRNTRLPMVILLFFIFSYSIIIL